MSLLAKAIAAKSAGRKRRVPTRDEIDLAMAFFRGDITCNQVSIALGRDPGSNTWHIVAGTLRNAIALGLVRLERK